MSLAPVAAAELAQTNAIVGTENARIGFSTHAGSQHRDSSLLHKRAAIDFGSCIFSHCNQLPVFRSQGGMEISKEREGSQSSCAISSAQPLVLRGATES